MGWKGTLRAIEAAKRRQQRDAQKRQRELEHQIKDQAKLSAIEQVRLEVEAHENKLEVLLSVHKEQGETWDWVALAASIPPPCPQKNSNLELKTRQLMLVSTSQQKEGAQVAIEEARSEDEKVFQEAMQAYDNEKAKQGKLKDLAFRILAHEHKAYIEALVEFSPLREISDLGSQLHFTVHSAKLIGCEINVNSTQTIPTEVKTLTSSGKLSIKPMPKWRFSEIYKDYLCGCVLRVAREVFAMLPVETLLVTALADSFDSSTGQTVGLPVLSVAMPRSVVEHLEFDRLNPSTTMEKFQIRGNFQALRKTEVFQPVTPLTPADIIHGAIENMGLGELIAKVQQMREEFKSKIAELSQRTSDTLPQNGQSL